MTHKNNSPILAVTPPAGTRWIMSRADLPATRIPARYRLTDSLGDATEVVIANTYRQVLVALRRGPIYCASPVRLSDVAFVLKRDFGVDIETLIFSHGDGSERRRFGIYRLRSRVECLGLADAKVQEAA